MTTLTTRAGFDAFRTRMCHHFAALPSGLGKQRLHVAQAELDPDTFFTHRLGDDGHRIIYDPRQVSAIKVRVFLGIYAEYTEGPVLDGTRNAYHQADCDGAREIWGIVLHEIDRTQDPGGVVDQIVELFSQARGGVSRV